MKIQKTTTSKAIPYSVAKTISVKKAEKAAADFAVQNNGITPYYKDCFINKNFNASFKGNIGNTPQNREELAANLSKTNKYSQDEINTILGMIDKIIEEDQWEETDEKLLIEMFNSLSESDMNSDLGTMEYVTNKICELEQDYDYIEINPVCKLTASLCSNIDSEDYRFERIFSGKYNGILTCDNQNQVFELCDLLKNLFKNVNTEKYLKLTDVLSKKIQAEDERLNTELSKIKELSEKYGYKDSELLDGLLLHYEESVPLDKIPPKLEKRKDILKVYQNLDNVRIPDKIFFEQVYTPVIEELVLRGYRPEEIAALLCVDDYCNKIINIEGMKNANPIVLADFIEDIPSIEFNYEIVRNYTKSSGLFNDLLSEYGGDLEKFPQDGSYVNDLGYIYGSEEAKNAINELTKFLDTMHLKRDISVYRGEGMEVLNQLILEDGSLLGDAINDAVKKKDMVRLEEITAEIIGSLIVQSHFMSSSYSKTAAKNFIKHEGGILWQIDAPKGANAIYADPFNTENGVECEILFNRNSSLIIKDAKLENGIYTVYADLIQTKEED